ncbi:unnamed protein product [Notodromas monacha]|uniref:MBD domain-containing protein n=1 Tax=Notodromas monacha TaxID=399045 RepID=A0A7R9BPR1_9CRUS|nr:unnamed protein product [Notodromas monacha]CAG0919379.1 unnamed protein product [Notodromas monacha]
MEMCDEESEESRRVTESSAGLPPGWKRILTEFLAGPRAGTSESVIVSPDGKEFISKPEPVNRTEPAAVQESTDTMKLASGGHLPDSGSDSEAEEAKQKQSMILRRKSSYEPNEESDVSSKVKNPEWNLKVVDPSEPCPWMLTASPLRNGRKFGEYNELARTTHGVPPGYLKLLIQRRYGCMTTSVIIISPTGKRLWTPKDVSKYAATRGLDLKPEDFNFSKVFPEIEEKPVRIVRPPIVTYSRKDKRTQDDVKTNRTSDSSVENDTYLSTDPNPDSSLRKSPKVLKPDVRDFDGVSGSASPEVPKLENHLPPDSDENSPETTRESMLSPTKVEADASLQRSSENEDVLMTSAPENQETSSRNASKNSEVSPKPSLPATFSNSPKRDVAKRAAALIGREQLAQHAAEMSESESDLEPETNGRISLPVPSDALDSEEEPDEELFRDTVGLPDGFRRVIFRHGSGHKKGKIWCFYLTPENWRLWDIKQVQGFFKARRLTSDPKRYDFRFPPGPSFQSFGAPVVHKNGFDSDTEEMMHKGNAVVKSDALAKKNQKLPASERKRTYVEVLRTSENMPLGWVKVIIRRVGGPQDGVHYSVIMSPNGHRLRAPTTLDRYIKKHGIKNITASMFDFRTTELLKKHEEEQKQMSKKVVREETLPSSSPSIGKVGKSTSKARSEKWISPTQRLSNSLLRRATASLPGRWVHLKTPKTIGRPKKWHSVDRKRTIRTQDSSRNQWEEIFATAEGVPAGWKKVIKRQTSGRGTGRIIPCFVTPCGRRLWTTRRVVDYVSQKRPPGVELSQFDFSVNFNGKDLLKFETNAQ